MLMMTETKLLEYNCFGLISISRERVTATVTAVSGNKSITRSAIDDLEKPLADVADGEMSAVVFGAWLAPGQKARVTIHEVGTLKSGAMASDLPQVGKVLSRALDMVRKASGMM